MNVIRLYIEMWPVVFWVFDGVQSDEDMDFYFTKLDEIHARKEPFGSIAIMRKFHSNRKHLMRVADWLKNNKKTTADYNVAAGMVTSSPLFRFVLSSLFLIQPMQVPYRVFADTPDAVSWVSEQMKARNITLPKTLSQFVPV